MPSLAFLTCIAAASSVALGLAATSADAGTKDAKADHKAAAEAAARRLPRYVQRNIGYNRDAHLSRVANLLYRVSPDGRATRDRLAISAQRRIARGRARVLSYLLAHDLDGDAALSAKEIASALGRGWARDSATLAVTRRSADKNGDGALSFDELRAHATAHAARSPSRFGRYRRRRGNIRLMDYDANGDGMVEFDEVVRVVDAVVRLGLGKKR